MLRFKMILLVACITGSMAIPVAMAAAQPGRGSSFHNHRQPPPTTGNNTGQQRMHPSHDMFRRQQHHLFMLMMMSRLQSPLMYPAAMYPSSMSSLYYPMPYSPPPPRQPMNVAVAANVPVPPMFAGIIDVNGQVSWPLGLQMVKPPLEMKQLRDRLESQILLVAQQATQGGAAIATIDAAKKDVAQLKQALQQLNGEIAAGTYRDAEAFLRRLETTLQGLRL